MTGVVKMYTDPHGYGFIDGDDGQSYFANISKVKNARELQPGQMVSFDPEETKKGMAAINIEVKGDK